MRHILKINNLEIICSNIKYYSPNKKVYRQYFTVLEVCANTKNIDITIIDPNNHDRTIVCFCHHKFSIGVIKNIQSLLLTSEI